MNRGLQFVKCRWSFGLIKRPVLLVVLFPFFALDRIYHRLLFAVSTCRAFDGFKLYSIEDDVIFFELATKALAVLKNTDRRRYERALAYIPIIAHVKQGGNFYKRPARAFYVHEYPEDIAYFASLIVHEATHGSLLHRHVRRDNNRHERICIDEQLRFITRFIHAQPQLSITEKQEMTRRWQAWFRQELASDWWDEKQIIKRQMAAFKQTVGELRPRQR